MTKPAKFMVLYNTSAKASQLMAKATPEQIKANIDEWQHWTDTISEKVKVAIAGTTSVKKRSSAGQSSMEAGSDQDIYEALKNHPHLSRPDHAFDVLKHLAAPSPAAAAE